jgi:hypothetical protein
VEKREKARRRKESDWNRARLIEVPQRLAAMEKL